jgi:hypothetical protein
MLSFFVSICVQPFGTPAEHGLFETKRLYLVRVTATEVPNHPKLYGDTRLRIDEVLIGPKRLKGTAATYKFFAPRNELTNPFGHRYAGDYPDFAYPAPQGQSRFWWASPDGDRSWKTANFRSLAKYLPPPGPELLLKADLKAGSKQATEQTELVEALVKLEGRRTWLGQVLLLREFQGSKNVAVYSAADRILKVVTTPSKEKKN